MASPVVSIIVPTHNRKQILQKVIQGYDRQTVREDIFELLIIDDGSTDGTADLVAECAATGRIALRCLRQECRGAAVARNRGISEACGEIILFTDDDIIPARTVVEEHLAWHKDHPERNLAVLGYVEWAPELYPTPFMRWLSHAGPYFSYGYLSPGGEATVGNFYTCNVSLKLDFLKATGWFDEDFRGCGLEDNEFGYRLFKNGMRLFYNPYAVGYHWKRVTFADVKRRLIAVWAIRQAVASKETVTELRRLWTERMNYRAYRRKLRAIMPFLMPLSFILDSQIPLPSKVYRAFYHYQDYMVRSGK